jgi:hypothetical protein
MIDIRKAQVLERKAAKTVQCIVRRKGARFEFLEDAQDLVFSHA